MDGSTNATEFDGEGVRKFVQQNISAIEKLFPKAATKYADLVEATKNGTNECSLYSFNLYGNEKYAGHVLEYVSPDTMKVVDIEAKNCEENTSNQIVRFLFSYCGAVSDDPVVERTAATADIAKDNCPATKTDDEWVNVISNEEIEICASGANCDADTVDFPAEKCAPGGDCNGDGIPDGIRRPDLEPCDTDTLLEFYNRYFQCVENKWERLDSDRAQARNATLEHRVGPAVTPIVVKVLNADGTVSIRDDGYNARNNFVMEAVYTEISGDTIIVDVVYPDGATLSSYQIGALTFTVSKVYTNVKYLKYKDEDNAKEIHEDNELLPCASNTSCTECPEGQDCGGMAW
jgi:hypothetical protein